MNRESAYKLNTHITGVLQAKRWKEAVDKIYDDISAQTCSSCKYHGRSDYCNRLGLHISDDWHCADWEKQDDIKRS